MSYAHQLGRRKRIFPRPIRKIAREVHAVAVQSGDRAYQFVPLPDGSLVEVRVWPDGKVKLTAVDRRGMPLTASKPPPLQF